ncbi:MAG: MGMT family protein [Pirellulales bacterium]|nr:MGMT family protein [Pirellulales bacterium]
MAKAKSTKIKWKPKAGTTWKDKLHKEHPNHGSLRPIPPIWHKRFGEGTMLIPRPLDLDALIRRVRKGKLVSQSQLRENLAHAAGATATCPITTGIFLRIVAEAAEEDLAAGKKRITPYWRVVSDDGRLNEKLPGGIAAQSRRLQQEGLSIIPGKGKKPPQVADFEKKMASFDRS